MIYLYDTILILPYNARYAENYRRKFAEQVGESSISFNDSMQIIMGYYAPKTFLTLHCPGVQCDDKEIQCTTGREVQMHCDGTVINKRYLFCNSCSRFFNFSKLILSLMPQKTVIMQLSRMLPL